MSGNSFTKPAISKQNN